MNKILIVIDAQEDFTRGALRNEDAIKALPILHEVVKYAVKNNFRAIIFTKDTHFDNYLETAEGKNLPIKHCIKGTDGWQLCHEVLCEFNKIPVYYCEKYTFGMYSWDEFCEDEFTPDLEEIWLCGFCTDICVSANYQIIKSVAPYIPITVIADACAGVTLELHEAALKVMASCHANIKNWNELNI